MRKLYSALAWIVAGGVVVQAAAIAFGFGGMAGYVMDGGVVDKALMESRQAHLHRGPRVPDPRDRRRAGHAGRRPRARHRLVLRPGRPAREDAGVGRVRARLRPGQRRATRSPTCRTSACSTAPTPCSSSLVADLHRAAGVAEPRAGRPPMRRLRASSSDPAPARHRGRRGGAGGPRRGRLGVHPARGVLGDDDGARRRRPTGSARCAGVGAPRRRGRVPRHPHPVPGRRRGRSTSPRSSRTRAAPADVRVELVARRGHGARPGRPRGRGLHAQRHLARADDPRTPGRPRRGHSRQRVGRRRDDPALARHRRPQRGRRRRRRHPGCRAGRRAVRLPVRRRGRRARTGTTRTRCRTSRSSGDCSARSWSSSAKPPAEARTWTRSRSSTSTRASTRSTAAAEDARVSARTRHPGAHPCRQHRPGHRRGVGVPALPGRGRSTGRR